MQIENYHVLLEAYQIFLGVNVPKGGKAIIDIDGTILMANDLNLIFSLEKGTLLSDVFSEITRDVSPKILRESIVHNKIIRHDVLFTERGTDYWFQLTISPISTEVAAIFLVEFTDITDYKSAVSTAENQRQRIEEELLLRTREIVQTDLFAKDHGGFLTNFMRGLRHDLLSPVVQLKNIIEYNRNTNDSKKKEQAAQLIDDCLEKLSNTARGFSNFVDLHILSHGKMESIKIDELFTEVKELLSENIAQTKATITTDFGPAKTVFFNRMIMSSIIHNLLSNAIKFRREDTVPDILVKAYLEDSNFVFLVKDNGTGIDLAAHGAKLFVPFQRLHPDRSGVGVGLSMIKNTLASYKGEIRVESVVGEWTTILVYIPQNNV